MHHCVPRSRPRDCHALDAEFRSCAEGYSHRSWYGPGITVQAPSEDRYLMRRSELLSKMAGAMGGRAAEEITFGDITTGASQDIEYASNIARRMVCEFGMSPLGNILMKRDADGGSTVSPETAARADQEVARLVDQSYQTALSILREKQDKLVAIAEHLIEVETIDGSELDAMLFGEAA